MSKDGGDYYAYKGYATSYPFYKKRTIKPMAVNYPKTKILQMIKESYNLSKIELIPKKPKKKVIGDDMTWDDFGDFYKWERKKE